MVDDTVMLRRYLPLAADGLALTMLSSNAEALSIRFCGGKEVLPTGDVDDPALVDAELDLAGLDLLDRLGDVDGDGAGLRVGHEAARPEHLAELAHDAHHVGSGDHGVEVRPPALDLVDEVVAADGVGAGVLGFFLLVGSGDDQHVLGLAEPVRQHDRAAHHLIRVLGIDTQADRQRDGLVELGELQFLEQRQCFLQPVGALFDLLARREVFLPALPHVPPPWFMRVRSTLPRTDSRTAASG